MLKIETQNQFNGFGTTRQQGEYFYSQGMSKSYNGIVPGWKVNFSTDQSGLSGLGLVQWFTQGVLNGNSYILGFDSNHKIYKTLAGVENWSLGYTPTTNTGSGNGLIVDQKNRLIYIGDRYVGMSSDLVTFTDQWKDMGSTVTGLKQATTYEDWIMIPHGNNLVLISMVDDSINTSGFNFPSGFTIRAVKPGNTGVLIGANFNNRSVLALWDGRSYRSIAPWMWLNSNINAIVPYNGYWLVITKTQILWTNGYSIRPFAPRYPDARLTEPTYLTGPQGAEVIENKLVFFPGTSGFNRKKSGLYILDLDTFEFEFAPVHNNVVHSNNYGAIFYDNLYNIHLSYGTLTPVSNAISTLVNSQPSSAHIISDIFGDANTKKTAEFVRLKVGIDTKEEYRYAVNFTVTVKLYNFKKPLWGISQTSVVSPTLNQLRVDGTSSNLNRSDVGDEVYIWEGVNAGQRRYITAIANQGTVNELWTLDSNLPNPTESGINFNVSPFQMVQTRTVTQLSGSELYFRVGKSIDGKQFLAKVSFDNIVNSVPELQEITLGYNELETA